VTPPLESAVIACTLDGIITSWDASAAKVFGFGEREAVGQSIGIIIPPEGQAEAEEMRDRVGRGETIPALQSVRLRKDGSPIEVEQSLYPARDELRRIVGILAIMREVRELRLETEARAYLATIVDWSDDAIVGKDLDGVVMSWNRAAERIFGYTAAEAIGRSIKLIIPPARWAEEEEVLNKIRRDEAVDHFETVRVRKDGSPVEISLTVSPVKDHAGKVIGASKIARDVSQRKLIEKQRDELYEQAQRNNRAKDEFLAMLSHELRNPIGAISSAMQVLGHPDVKAEAAKQARDIIGRQTRKLTRIVEDLLDVGRVLTGKVRLDAHPMDLSEAARSSVNALRISGRADQHLLTLDATPVWVVADFVRIEQIVGNLLDNALKYTPPHGTIRLSLRQEGAEAVLEVQDSGAGIPRTLLPEVFDLFVQGERSLDRSQGGLGIGLTLVRRLVEQHDGSVQAFSEGVGSGSRFTIRLPAVDAPKSHPATHGLARTQTRRVLIIEDDRDTREMLRSYLLMAGHRVFEAPDGEKGIEAALRLAPDVALIDIGLPKLDGYEVARRVRQSLGANPMLVAISGYGGGEDRRRSKEAGFDMHLVKPVDPVEVAGILGRQLRGEGPASAGEHPV
jgi:PAS domain S-box-containing protein